MKNREMTGAEAARKRMIQRMGRRLDNADQVPPPINGGEVMKEFLRAERSMGLLSLSDDETAKKRLHAAALRVWGVFGERLARANVKGLFLWPEDCGGIYAESDGMTVRRTDQAGKVYFMIGVYEGAAYYGEDYLLLVLIHEAAHALNFEAGHYAYWHGFLDQLLAEFNQRTGRELVNDYASFNDEGRRKPPGQPWIHRINPPG